MQTYISIQIYQNYFFNLFVFVTFTPHYEGTYLAHYHGYINNVNICKHVIKLIILVLETLIAFTEMVKQKGYPYTNSFKTIDGDIILT